MIDRMIEVEMCGMALIKRLVHYRPYRVLHSKIFPVPEGENDREERKRERMIEKREKERKCGRLVAVKSVLLLWVTSCMQ